MRAHSFLRPFAVVAACLSVMGTALADTFGNFTYTSNGTAVTITGHANAATSSLVIPAEINGVPVRTLGQNSFANFTSLQTVTFPAGLLTIGNFAFGSCSALTSLDLPASLTTIDSNAFYNCAGLTSVVFPSALTTIQDGAFASCSGLTSLTLPPALTMIGSGVFSGCTGLTSVTVPESVTRIGDNAFWNCPSLTEVNLPARFLSSLSPIGFDYVPEVASNVLVSGIANELAKSPAFVTKVADTVLAKNGHYGLATQADISAVIAQTPQAVRDALAEIGTGPPTSSGITSDLGTLAVKKGKPVAYSVTSSFGATAFAAIGLPDGVVINAGTGVISGKAKKVGTYNVFLYAGIPGGGSVNAVKVISVTP